MKQNKSLTLRFNCDNGKKYSIHVKDANENLQAEAVKRAADDLIRIKAFDFDGKGSGYQLSGATYTTTNRNQIIG